MGIYRLSRSLEASLVDAITTAANTSWNGTRVIKNFTEVYDKKATMPAICITLAETENPHREVGSTEVLKNHIVNFRIFATDDGMRMDMADWLIDLLKVGFDYYTYTVAGGIVTTKTKAGYININRFTANQKEYLNLENIDVRDRYRHLITCEIRVALS